MHGICDFGDLRHFKRVLLCIIRERERERADFNLLYISLINWFFYSDGMKANPASVDGLDVSSWKLEGWQGSMLRIFHR